MVDPEDIRRALRPDTKIISVMHANNETGVIQPVAEIARMAHDAGILMHSDGVQAAGKIPVNVRTLDVDLYSISGHKIYAPKGVGALYVRKGTKLTPVQRGGAHERGMRAGTENVAGAVGLGRAAQGRVFCPDAALAGPAGTGSLESSGRMRMSTARARRGLPTRPTCDSTGSIATLC